MNELQTKLDRLADGELSQQDYVELLGALDHEEEGWRKCALTFLENQALRTDLRKLIDEPAPQPVVERLLPTSSDTNGSHSVWHWIQGLTIAASLGLAFWLGRGSMTPGDLAVVELQPPSTQAISAPETEPWKQGRLKLVLRGADGEPREMELPVVDGNYVDPDAFLARSTVIPADVLAAIEQSGHKIERHREFMRRPIDAEHEVVVPVDRLRVVPVSNPMY
jgi:hypothetical protein